MEANINIPKIELSFVDTGYRELRVCFRRCIKDNSFSKFIPEQLQCLEPCLTKHKEANNFLALKLHQQLKKSVLQDPHLRQAFSK